MEKPWIRIDDSVAKPEPAVAVVVPCYNARATLGEALESVIGQSATAEIVVVDDGSTDNSLAVARRFAPLARLIEGPNRGVSAARNRGVAETTAEWLLFLDADDLLMPGTMERRLATATESGADVVICDWEDALDDGCGTLTTGPLRQVDWEALRQDPQRAIASHVWATTSAILYRRRVVERIGGFRLDLPVIQDARFMFDAAINGARFAHSRHVGARYRVLPGSLSRRDPARFWRDVLANGRQIEGLWRERDALDTARLGTLRDIYDHAARGLFAAGDSAFFDAATAQRSLGLPLTLRARIAAPAARAFGLHAARTLLALTGRRCVGGR